MCIGMPLQFQRKAPSVKVNNDDFEEDDKVLDDQELDDLDESELYIDLDEEEEY